MARRGPKPEYLTLVKAAEAADDLGADRCGGVTTSGTPCKRKAGWGTDHPGEGGCKDHPEERSSPCPFPLTELQAVVWNSLAVHMRRLGLLKAVNWPAMYGLTVAVARLHEADESIESIVVQGSRSSVKKHPATTVVNQMLSQVRSYCAELGITPSALAKIGVQEDSEPSRMDRLIQGDA